MSTPSIIDTLTNEHSRYEQEATALTIKDDTGAQAAMLFIAKCREAEKRLDAERRAKTDPLNDQIGTIMKPYKESIGWFERLRIRMDTRLQDFRRKRAAELQERQQLELADKRRREDEAAAILKKEQERLDRQRAELMAASAPPTASQQKAFDKQEAKVEAARAVAVEVAQAPVTVIEQQAKSTTLDDGTVVTSRKKPGWVFSNGLPKDTVFDRTDKRFANLPDDLFVFDPKRANGRCKGNIATDGLTYVDESITAVKAAKL